MGELINRYEVRAAEAGCAPGSGRYGLLVEIPNDISAVLPYLNAMLNDTQYHHQGSVLIWREGDQTYAVRSHEIRIMRIGGIDDSLLARELVSEIVERVNTVWRDRYRITPCTASKERPPVIDIYRLLPGTNCRQCGYVTCLVYAADLREGKTRLECCPPLRKPEHAESRQKLMRILSVD